MLLMLHITQGIDLARPLATLKALVLCLLIGHFLQILGGVSMVLLSMPIVASTEVIVIRTVIGRKIDQISWTTGIVTILNHYLTSILEG